MCVQLTFKFNIILNFIDFYIFKVHNNCVDHFKDTSSPTTTAYCGQTIFMPVQNALQTQTPQSQIELLRPLQEMNYDKSIKGEPSNNNSGMIFTELIEAESDMKHSTPTSSQKVNEVSIY